MNCTEIREKLVEYIEDLLRDWQKQQLESHLLMRHYDGFMKSGKLKGRTR